MTVVNNPRAELVMFEPGTFIVTWQKKERISAMGKLNSTSNAVREELAIERPVAAGLRSRDEDSKEWCGLTNNWRECFLLKSN